MAAPTVDGVTVPVTPQDLAVGLLGLHVLGRAQPHPRARPPLPTRVFLTVLGSLGVSDAATRTALNRMVARGGLIRHRSGRTSAFEPVGTMVSMLQRGRARLFSPTPFDHPEDVWTILSCPIPESLRNMRYHLQARLAWAGFGMVAANLWIAPGRIDVESLLADIYPATDLVHAFHGAPTLPSSPAQLARSGWDPEALRVAHRRFAARWESSDRQPGDPLPRLLLLLEDWGRLLRTDPGIPIGRDDEHWPAVHSAAIFRRLDAELGPRGERQLDRMLCAPTDA